MIRGIADVMDFRRNSLFKIQSINSYREATEPEVNLLPVKHIQIQSLANHREMAVVQTVQVQIMCVFRMIPGSLHFCILQTIRFGLQRLNNFKVRRNLVQVTGSSNRAWYCWILCDVATLWTAKLGNCEVTILTVILYYIYFSN